MYSLIFMFYLKPYHFKTDFTETHLVLLKVKLKPLVLIKVNTEQPQNLLKLPKFKK